MSQSPLNDDSSHDKAREDYLNSWNALANLIRQGRSFSGRERNCCYLNTGGPALNSDGARFADVSSAIGLDLQDDGRGLAVVDWDHDGDLDLWLANRTGPRVRLMLNQLATPGAFIEFALQGTQCNRDAVGARVELVLEGAAATHVQTLRAGEGFLSQSSKIIHFGLGMNDTILEARVRWPGSAQHQTFVNLRPGRRYRLVQGQTDPEELPARRAVQLAQGELIPPAASDSTRIVLTQRRPLAPLTWKTFEGQDVTWSSQGQSSDGPSSDGQSSDVPTSQAMPQPPQATLINLWASWCRPCLSELEQLVAEKERLESRQLRVVLLNVDQKVDDARQMSQRLGLPFEGGTASESNLRVLTQLDRDTVYRVRPLPLPTSFLIDAQGNLSVIYKGPLDLAQLLADLDSINEPALAMVQKAQPFAGRNIAAWFSPSPVNVAKAYFDGGYADDALSELRRFLRQPAPDAERVRAWQLLANIGRMRNDAELELEGWRQSAQLQPDDWQTKLNLLSALHRAQRQEEALELLADLERAAERDPILLVHLGQFYMSVGNRTAAIERFQRAVHLDGDRAESRMNLAIAHQVNGETAAAIEQYRELLRAHPERLDAVNNLAWLLANEPATAEDRLAAVRLARRACRETNNAHPGFLDTLAVALAQAGDRPAAAEVLRSAIPLARGRGEQALAEKMTRRLRSWADAP